MTSFLTISWRGIRYNDGGAITTSTDVVQHHLELCNDFQIRGSRTGVGIQVGCIQYIDDRLLLCPRDRVHLEVSTDEELTRHGCWLVRVLKQVEELSFKCVKAESSPGQLGLDVDR